MFINEKHQQAVEHMKSGLYSEALLLFDQLIEAHVPHADLYADRGVLFLHMEQQDRCFNDLDYAIVLQPDYAYRYACRAFAKNHFGDIESAIRDYNKAIELEPDDAIAHNNLGMLLEKKGYVDEARYRFKQADQLTKMESRLFDLMEELENGTPAQGEKHDPDPSTIPTEKPHFGAVVRSTLTTKKGWGEFLRFIRNGFKIK